MCKNMSVVLHSTQWLHLKQLLSKPAIATLKLPAAVPIYGLLQGRSSVPSGTGPVMAAKENLF